MVADCCNYESACFKNEVHYTEEISVLGDRLVSQSQLMQANRERMKAYSYKINLAKSTISDLKTQIDKKCLRKGGKNRFTKTYATKYCVSGEIKTILKHRKANLQRA